MSALTSLAIWISFSNITYIIITLAITVKSPHMRAMIWRHFVSPSRNQLLESWLCQSEWSVLEVPLCFIVWYSLKQQNSPCHSSGHRWDFYSRTPRYLITWEGAMMVAQSIATALWDWLNTEPLIRFRNRVLSYDAGSRNINWCTQL